MTIMYTTSNARSSDIQRLKVRSVHISKYKTKYLSNRLTIVFGGFFDFWWNPNPQWDYLLLLLIHQRKRVAQRRERFNPPKFQV